MNKNMDFILADLPAIPEIVSLILHELNKEDPDFNNVENFIYKDTFITTKIIKLANSSFFNLSKQINDVRGALTYIGYKRLLNIVLIIGLSKSFSDIKGIDTYTLWRYSLNTSRLCETFSNLVKCDKGTALTVGLLHILGEFILHIKTPKEIEVINKQFDILDLDRSKIESQHLGVNYLEVTTKFLKNNKFSSSIITPISEQIKLNDSYPINKVSNIGLILNIASWISRIKTKDHTVNLFELEYPNDIITHLNLKLDDVLNRDDSYWVTKDDVAMIV